MNIVSRIRKNDLYQLKEYLRRNDIKEERIDDNYLEIIDHFCSELPVSEELKNFYEKYFDTMKLQVIKIIERKKEPKTVILNNSFSEEFINMPQNNDDDEIDDNILAQSYSFGQINKYREKFLNEPSSIILESFLYSKTN